MDSIRQQKVARLLQKELAEIFRAASKTLFHGAFISVTTVRVSPDLGVAKVYLSIMGADKKKVMEDVTFHTRELRKRVGNIVAKQLRIVPELQFFIDDSLDYAMHIEELLKK